MLRNGFRYYFLLINSILESSGFWQIIGLWLHYVMQKYFNAYKKIPHIFETYYNRKFENLAIWEYFETWSARIWNFLFPKFLHFVISDLWCLRFFGISKLKFPNFEFRNSRIRNTWKRRGPNKYEDPLIYCMEILNMGSISSWKHEMKIVGNIDTYNI